ncbi:helix-turn-helix domain-containing protein [Roseibium aggregatum]|uniref:Helix-turn-helix domain-containing protein n=1 Tax=Roseibium aggregatum TaxID=187304 RepID=A0A926P5P3_9HYPH|nr:helix-turn-helix domain-containing protein [Roseibium aggregatum]MBD1547922.1 helix-turn-helix domain-containing protein [Roseibium aggregatum]
MERLWSTDTIVAKDRLSYWVDLVCDTFVQLDCDAPDNGASFRGEIACGRLATLTLSQVTATPQWVRRTPAKIARTSEDYFLVSLQATGRGVVIQDGRTAELKPGDFALYDSTRPYELVFDGEFRQYVLQLPGTVLRSRMQDTEALTARTVDGRCGAGHLVNSMINSLVRDMESLEPASLTAVAESMENILVAGLSTLGGTPAPQLSGLTAFHRDQIKAHVATHLRDPNLSVGTIARALKISPSTIHRAFSSEAVSLNSWIWGQRLDAAKRDLCDPALARRSVSEIAFSWGFNDAAHFSRAFRARFGCTPRDLRAACMADFSPSSRPGL